MGDRSQREIKDINVGDQVLSADPKSSGSKVETVTQLHRNTDHDLTKLTLKDRNNKKSVLNTTQNHPFWDATDHKWTDAKNLRPGHHLKVWKSGDVTVIRVDNRLGTHEMRDLTVDELHTYYVFAGDTPVLVHNCNRTFATRAEAKNAAYDRAGISRDVKPDATWTVGDDVSRRGQPDYRFESNPGAHGNYEQFETENGSRVIVEHNNDPNAPLPHFHAGQPKADPSRNFVNLGHDVYDQSAPFERYSPIGGSHHLYYQGG